MIRRMRFFSKFVVANVRDGAIEADGKPARAKLKGNLLREVRKCQNDGGMIRGKPARAKLKENRSRDARKRQTKGDTIRRKPENEILTE